MGLWKGEPMGLESRWGESPPATPFAEVVPVCVVAMVPVAGTIGESPGVEFAEDAPRAAVTAEGEPQLELWDPCASFPASSWRRLGRLTGAGAESRVEMDLLRIDP